MKYRIIKPVVMGIPVLGFLNKSSSSAQMKSNGIPNSAIIASTFPCTSPSEVFLERIPF